MYYFSILFLSILSTWFISQLIKSITAIARPIVSNPIVIEHGYSFPSQHAALTMVVAVVIYSINKRLGMILLGMSLLVGISRIILGVHFPIDVLVGWGLGWFIGFLFIKLFKNV
jgi:undecaprenyl-diphosphatase